eukprot:Colp12_sorted_trinity150504_noHs@8742
MNKYVLVAALICLALPAVLAQCTKRNNVPTFDDASYYAAAKGKSGKDLMNALNKIISTGYIRYSYDCIWTIIEDSDEDIKNPNNVFLIYKGTSVPKKNHVGSVDKNQPSWNREHIWAKSHGFDRANAYGYSDAHHLRAADPFANSERSNKAFANGGTPSQECAQCKETKDSWEPSPFSKGDVARMIFYMATRYNGNQPSSNNMPALQLVDRVISQSDTSGTFGKLCDLYKWHFQEPVDQREKTRNEKIYKWQANRNPFIDHPEFVEAIWSNQCGSASDFMMEAKEAATEVEETIENTYDKVEGSLGDLMKEYKWAFLGLGCFAAIVLIVGVAVAVARRRTKGHYYIPVSTINPDLTRDVLPVSTKPRN